MFGPKSFESPVKDSAMVVQVVAPNSMRSNSAARLSWLKVISNPRLAENLRDVAAIISCTFRNRLRKAAGFRTVLMFPVSFSDLRDAMRDR